jgi:hypothetical protein
MHLGANILLPKGYDEHPEMRYPVHYIQGHFPRGRVGRFAEDPANESFKIWNEDDLPRFIQVTFEHNCFQGVTNGLNVDTILDTAFLVAHDNDFSGATRPAPASSITLATPPIGSTPIRIFRFGEYLPSRRYESNL